MKNQSDPKEPTYPAEFASRAAMARPGPLRELLTLLRCNKKWWLTPVILLLLLISAVVILGGTAAAPFLYTIF